MKKILYFNLIFLFLSFLTGSCSQLVNTPTSSGTFNPTNVPILSPPVVSTEIPTPTPSEQAMLVLQKPTIQSRQTSSTPVAVTSPTASTPTVLAEQPSSTSAATVSSSCTDTAGFFGDVTVPDGTSLDQNVPFVKTWSIRNEGTCSWGPDYSLIFYGGNQMSGPLSVPLPVVAPGDITNISVNLKSPSSGGEFTGFWEFQNSSGKRFGVNSDGIDHIWVKIGVSIFNETGGIVPVGATPVPTVAIVSNTSPIATVIVINNTTPNPTTIVIKKATPNASEAPLISATPALSNTCIPQENNDYEQQILGLINAARAQNNLSPFTLNSKLSAAAYMHSTDMACNNYVDHIGSDGSTWFTRIKAEKYTYNYASENIYVGNPGFGGTPQGAFTWWMNDQIHRDNILTIKASEIGIGYAFYTNSTYGGYYTLDFAKP